MKQHVPSIRPRLGATIFLLMLLLTGCVAVQPPPNGATIPSADSDAVLTWEGAPLSDPTLCGRLQIDRRGEATFGPCDAAGVMQPLGAHAQEWAEIQERFAPFTYTTDATTLILRSTGEVAGEARQRALAAWAQLVYGELSAGRTSASVATAMSWFVGPVPEQADLCQHLVVLSYSYAYAQTTPCAGGEVQAVIGGMLTDGEIEQFDQWLYGYTPIYVENNYLVGVGTQEAGEAEIQSIDAWAQAVYERLQASGSRAATPAETSAWQSYQADSGYAIQYPLALYSLRAGQSGPNVLFPGVRVVEPNDAFTYRDREQTVYKLSIAVSTNDQGLSLDQPESLLANSAIIAYDPALLADHPIQQIELDGVPALRVDDLPVGPAGITTQIVALYHEFIYELMVEPHVVTTNQAEPWVESAPSEANDALIEQIINTFHFTE